MPACRIAPGSILPALALLALFAAPPARGQALDPPVLSTARSGHGKVGLYVTAGASGAPHGFTVYWMTQEDFDAYGDQWPQAPGSARLAWANYDGVPTLNTGGGAFSTFRLEPFQSVAIEIGDVADETGVATNDPYELMYGTSWGLPYAFTAVANGGAGIAASALAIGCAGATIEVRNCTYTIGYWKNHPDEWPVGSLVLGSVTYSKAQLLAILGTSVKGNGLVSLAHQLIGARLNLANGASPLSVAVAIAAAAAQIGSLVVPPIGSGFLEPSQTSGKTQILDDFNNGITGPGHCESTRATDTSWGGLKLRYR